MSLGFYYLIYFLMLQRINFEKAKDDDGAAEDLDGDEMKGEEL